MTDTIHTFAEQVHSQQARATRLFTTPLATQRELYQTRDSKIRECLREEIDAWASQRYPGLDPRTMYAEAMSLACEEHISRATVNNWSSNDGNRFPLSKAYGHLVVTGSNRLLEIAVDGSQCSVCNREDSLYSQKGRLEAEVAERQRKISLIEMEIREAKS